MTQRSSDSARPSRWLVAAAFAAIYLIWGSSYVTIHFAVETIPPFLMGGARFLLAGTLLLAWARARGAALPARREWASAAVAGGLLFLINNGAIVWASQYVPSNVVALLIGITPVWMVLLDWWRPGLRGRRGGGQRPPLVVFAGLALGLLGVGLLVGGGELRFSGDRFVIGALSVVVGTIAWAAGSLYARRATLPSSPIVATAAQLFSGGLMLLALSAAVGEWQTFDPAAVAPRSVASLIYLVLMGSILGFGSYVWLLRVSTPARVATYAYVNPVVAVFLGWALAGEQISLRTIVAAAVIIGAVMLVNGAGARAALPGLRRMVRAHGVLRA